MDVALEKSPSMEIPKVQSANFVPISQVKGQSLTIRFTLGTGKHPARLFSFFRAGSCSHDPAFRFVAIMKGTENNVSKP